MDVTPQVLHEVEFRAKVRGYDPDEVDDFLERVAAGVGQLQERLREAVDKAGAAESRVAELHAKLKASAAGGDTDETLRRTLVLAQRTADAAIKEANEEAERTLAEATERAAALVGDAEQRAAAALKSAEDEVRKGVDATRQRLVSEIIDLEATRDSVRADIAVLERHLDEQRLRLRAAIADLQRIVDDPAALKGLPPPLLTEATLPARFAPPVESPAPAPQREVEPEEAEPEPVAEEDPLDEVDEPGDAEMIDAEEDEGELLAGDDDGDDALFAPPSVRDQEEGDWSVAGKGRIGLFDDLEGEDDRRGFEFDPPGQHTEPVAHIPEGPEGDDAYLAELRKAMLTSEADGDTDDDELPPPAVEDAPKFRSRFGRRR